MRRLGVAAACVALALAGLASAGAGNGTIGRAPTAAELRAADISIAPDGRGLPPGRGSSRDGEAPYQSLCAACHGARGEGRGDFPALVGGRGSVGTASPVLTVGSYWPYATTLWDYIRRAMPYLSPGTLTPDQVYALTAFLLRANDIIPADLDLTEKTLPRVRMPNRAVVGEQAAMSGTLVGFFSKHHQGAFTHMGQNIHAHVVNASAALAAHADQVSIRASSILVLPR